MLALVHLPHLAQRRPAQLSGGQQQRVALARALATRPSVLMLDEPLGALDLKLRRQLQDELRRIHRETGATFLFVTHDQEEAMYLSDRVAVMRTGRIEQLDDPRTIYRRPVNAFVADFIGDICFLDGVHEPSARSVRLRGGAALETALERPPGQVRLAVRPEHVVVHTDPAAPGTPATIGEVTHDTGTTMLQLQLQGGDTLKARRLGVDDGALQPGQTVRVRLGRETLAFDPA
jgi:ABC-type Fe3+/spermidine/putrescine transport system ATPase subunit